MATPNNRNPIIICPGLGGTSLDFELDDTLKSTFCNGYFVDDKDNIGNTLWLNALGLADPTTRPCLLTLMKPIYDSCTDKLTNTPGLTTKVHGPEVGNILNSKCLDYIDNTDNCFILTNYADNLIKFLSTRGYTPNVDLLTLGYDFRLVPYKQYLQDYFNVYRDRIEELFNLTSKRIHLIAHSLGCLITNMFLNIQSQKWKNKYIKSFIPISPAYDGGPKALRAVLSGDNFDLNPTTFGSDLEYRDAERTIAGIAATIPLNPEVYVDGLAVTLYNAFDIPTEKCKLNDENRSDRQIKKVTVTEAINYNVRDYKDGIMGILRSIAKKANDPELYETANLVKSISKYKIKYGWSDPKVKVNQLMITTRPTEAGAYTYDLSKQSLSADPSYNSTALGDGTVPVNSLMIPKLYKWKDITFKEFPSTEGDHTTLFTTSTAAFNYILSLLSS